MTTTGEKVWNRLRAEGGFVHTMSDGRQFVRFNRGHHPSAELVEMLKRHREELKCYVDEMHAARDRAWAHPWGIGSSRPVDRRAPMGRGGDGCECNDAARSGISSETADFRPGRHRPVKTAAISALAALLAAFMPSSGEISGALAGPVDLRCVLLTEFPLGKGRACAWCQGINETGGQS